MAYKLQLLASMSYLHNVFHILLLSRHTVSDLLNRKCYSPLPGCIDDTDKFYEVEEIMNIKKVQGKYQFLISWKGYPDSGNSWESKENLMNCC